MVSQDNIFKTLESQTILDNVFLKYYKMKPDEHNLIIGIPARNEEKTIYDTLKSILDEAQYFSSSIDIKILVVINHSVDNTEAVVDRFCKKYQNYSKNISISKTYSKAGIIKAQKKYGMNIRAQKLLFL